MTMCLGVMLTSIFLSWDESQSSPVDETPVEETIEFFLEDMSLGR